MRIYAIRDRLIDYFMTPFAAPGDKEVMAALSKRVNYAEGQDDIGQAPHHFELWKLGEVLEDGHIESNRELICDCSSLVRHIRPKSVEGAPTPDHHPGRGQATPSVSGGDSNANPRPLPIAPPGA